MRLEALPDDLLDLLPVSVRCLHNLAATNRRFRHLCKAKLQHLLPYTDVEWELLRTLVWVHGLDEWCARQRSPKLHKGLLRVPYTLWKSQRAVKSSSCYGMGRCPHLGLFCAAQRDEAAELVGEDACPPTARRAARLLRLLPSSPAALKRASPGHPDALWEAYARACGRACRALEACKELNS